MDWKKHQKIDKILLGKEFPEVHEWIDEKYPLYRDWEHWKERHHLEAIKEKYQEGTLEFLSAVIHVISDWISHERTFELPRDRKETLETLAYYNLINLNETKGEKENKRGEGV